MTDQPDPGEETALLEATIEALSEELAALRAVACGYCPHCGRGDAAPTVQHWEHQRQRADTAERERDTARQHAAAIAAQRDRLRQRMTTLADRWDHGLAVDAPYARTLRDQISAAPFDPDGAMTVSEYTERGRRLWVFRCWGTDTCDGWLGLGHHTQTSALIERERHVAEAHEEPTPASPAEAAAERVRALHTRVLRMEALVCGHCGHTWPCATISALNAPAATEATEPCGHLSPTTMLTTPPVPCTAPAGHDGDHHDDRNVRWYNAPAADESARTTPNNTATSKEPT